MGWSYEDFMTAPAEWIPEIVDLITEEAERYGAKPDSEPVEPEMVKVETGDGTIRYERKEIPADKAVQSVFGVPPSRRK